MSGETQTRAGRAVVIGGGARGRTHARVLRRLGLDVLVVSEQRDLPMRSGATLDAAAEAGFGAPDYWVIAKPTRAHAVWLSAVLARDGDAPILVEKPLFDTAEDLAVVAPKDEKRITVGHVLRFAPTVQALRDALGDAALVRARFVGGVTDDPSSSGRDLSRALACDVDLATSFIGGWTRATALSGRRVGAFAGGGPGQPACVELMAMAERCPMAAIEVACGAPAETHRIEVLAENGAWTADVAAGRLSRDGGEARSFGPYDALAALRAMHAAALAPGDRDPRLATVRDAAKALALIEATQSSLEIPRWVESPLAAGADVAADAERWAAEAPAVGWPKEKTPSAPTGGRGFRAHLTGLARAARPALMM